MAPKRPAAKSKVEIDDAKKRKAENRKKRSDNQTPAEKARSKQINAQRTAQWRQNMTNDERAHIRVNNSERMVQSRLQMSDEQRQIVRQSDAQRASRRIENLTDSQRIQHNSNNRNYRKRQRERAQTGIIPTARIPDFNEDSVAPHNCGKLNYQCVSCNAKHFREERPSDKLFTQCCHKGKVSLPPIKMAPIIKDLMNYQHLNSKNFHENIRSINSALAFASMGADIKPPPGYGPYCFRINGQIYHRSGALHPENDDQRKFAQLYILDPEEACSQRLRMRENSHCDLALMQELSTFMAENNPFAEACKMLHEVEKECISDAQKNNTEVSKVTMAIVQDRTSDKRRYNSPRVNEVAVVFSNCDGEPPLERDLVIHCRVTDNLNARKTQRISVLDPNLEPLVYPLLFPYGDQSWNINIPLNYKPDAIAGINKSTNPRTRVTQMQYYGFRLSIRDDFNQFLSAGKLTQQYFVDAYVKTEANRLNYVRQNQGALRVENYTGLLDHHLNAAEKQGLIPGTAIILPSSFQGSPRNMQQNYQDAMAIVRKYGKPDLFITMTCNPKWVEIQENLEPGQSTEYRPDLVARVFQLKLKALLKDIKSEHIFGVPTAIVHVIEFQKRGLPHAHILLILKDDFKPKDADLIDNLISAEIPDINKFPKLHEIVTKHMVHGPCGDLNLNSPCMVNGQCSKNFPKTFQSVTISNSDGYPKYRRRDNGTTVTIKNKTVDNTWIVPYNPVLSLKYNCHINVESCASVQSVKYLFKYIYKGHDCANIEIAEKGILNHDEIKTFMDSRYVSAPEAAWRLFGFHMHEQSHTIMRLQVHVPGKQNVFFTDDNIPEAIERAANKNSTLMAWFKLNQENESACNYLYSEIPQHFVFDKRESKWKERQRGGDNVIGRMYAVNMAADPERYCLRLLLLHVKGATSFEMLQSYEDQQFSTFKEAAQKRGLFKDDNTWDYTLEEAIVWKMPRQLRDLFAYICVFVVPHNALELFNKYKFHLYEDVSRHDGHTDDCTVCEDFALSEIQATLLMHGKTCVDFGLPDPIRRYQPMQSFAFDALLEGQKSSEMIASLNADQKNAFDKVITAINNENLPHRCFFLDGPGGSGKTYLYKTFISYMRSIGGTVLPVASTGIAANLLDGGRTYHSQFKLPIPLLDTSTSSMRMTSNDAQQLRTAKLLIWDESTMAPSLALNAVNKLLQEVMQNSKPFGGKTLLMGGDFRQTLPVVPHGSRSAIVQATIKFNQLWDRFTVLKLSNNVRSVDQEFSDWLINVGDGNLPTAENLPEDSMEIPPQYICEGSIVSEIFGDHIRLADIPKFANRAILCPKNSDVDKVNEEVLNLLEGELYSYMSSDTIDDEDSNDRENYPIEFLHSLTPSGMPVHNLNLKIGCIIILLRNLNTKRGLCNGTRLTVKDLKPNLILAEVLTGSAEKQMVFIPRIDLAPSNLELPFILRRRQFPIKLAFAMTINKSQGQTLELVGIYLNEPVFSHGQLYVALSRVRRACDVKIKIIDGPFQGKLVQGSDSFYTKNVVYREIFSKDQ